MHSGKIILDLTDKHLQVFKISKGSNTSATVKPIKFQGSNKGFITKLDEKFETQDTTIHNLERQMRQLANILSENAPGTLFYDTEKNPKETIKIICLRSDTILKDLITKPKGELTSKQANIAEKQKMVN